MKGFLLVLLFLVCAGLVVWAVAGDEISVNCGNSGSNCRVTVRDADSYQWNVHYDPVDNGNRKNEIDQTVRQKLNRVIRDGEVKSVHLTRFNSNPHGENHTVILEDDQGRRKKIQVGVKTVPPEKKGVIVIR